MAQHRQLQLLLYQALANSIGLLVRVEGDPVQARQKFYAAKYTAEDLTLAEVEIKHAPEDIAPTDGGRYLVIFKRSALEALHARQAPPEPAKPSQSKKAGLFAGLSVEDLGFDSDGEDIPTLGEMLRNNSAAKPQDED